MADREGSVERARLRLIGAFQLADASGRPLRIASRRARGLIAFLALSEEQRASRERLRVLLWRDRAAPQGSASLRQCLLELRQVLAALPGEVIITDRDSVALAPGTIDCDVVMLEEALTRGDGEALAARLDQAGPDELLADLDAGAALRDWVERRRARLRRTLSEGVAALFDTLAGRGDQAGARRLGEAYLRRDPLDRALLSRMGWTGEAVAPAPSPAAAEGVAEAGAVPSTGIGTGAGQPALVVVAPFETNAPGALAPGLRDEVIAGLARFRELGVLAEPRPEAIVAAQAAAGRDAGYLLRASLRAEESGLRLVAQLSRNGSGRVVWSESFAARAAWGAEDRDRLIARIVGAVLPMIAADMAGNPGENPEHRGYERVILTRGPDFKPRTFAEARAAADSLETMIAANPAFPMPYFPLAYLYNTDFGYTRAGSSGPEERARAMQLSRAGLALDRSHVHGYTVTGWCHLRRREFAAARTFFEQAFALNPFHARRVMEVGWGYLFLGDLEGAEAMFDRCLLLFPSPADGFFMDLGLLALLRGEHDKADGYFDITADPEIWTPIYRAINAVLAGRPDADRTATARARVAAIWPDDRPLTGEAVIAWFRDHHPFQSPLTGAALFDGAEKVFRTIG